MAQSQPLKIAESKTEWTPKHLDIVAGAFVASLLVSNVVAGKLFQFGPAIFTAGILVFPISYIFGDVLTEVYGFNRARRVIYVGFLANVFLVLILWVAIRLPPAPGWNLQPQFAAVHALVPRIVVASILGYLGGEIANSFIMSVLKVKTSAKLLWVRTISSTVAGQLVDTALFVAVGFAGIMPTHTLILATISGWVFKVIYEAAATPLTYWMVAKLKRLEGVEHFDKRDKRTLFQF